MPEDSNANSTSSSVLADIGGATFFDSLVEGLRILNGRISGDYHVVSSD